jgi:hypothetical protein
MTGITTSHYFLNHSCMKMAVQPERTNNVSRLPRTTLATLIVIGSLILPALLTNKATASEVPTVEANSSLVKYLDKQFKAAKYRGVQLTPQAMALEEGFCESCSGSCYDESYHLYHTCITNGGTNCTAQQDQYYHNCQVMFCGGCPIQN